MNAIEIVGLYKKYRDTVALNGVSLQVKEGELFGLLGMNGAGKTTLIKSLTGLCKTDGGSAFVCGFSVEKELDRVREVVGISPQETAVAPKLTVKENLRFFAQIYGASEEKLEELCEQFSLNEVLNKSAKTLSGGYMRRLSIAISLVSSPKVLFLDEPTLGLDVLARRELWQVINSLKGKVTVVLTSHYLEEIEALCDRVGILAKGNLLSVGTLDEVKAYAGEQKFEDAFIKIAQGGVV